MRITHVTYGRLVSGDNFSNERIELTSDVEPDEDYTKVLAELRGEVDRLLKKGSTISTSADLVKSLRGVLDKWDDIPF